MFWHIVVYLTSDQDTILSVLVPTTLLPFIFTKAMPFINDSAILLFEMSFFPKLVLFH